MEKIMSTTEYTTCDFVKEVENAAREAKGKAAEDWNSPLSTSYFHASLELRKIVLRHVRAGRCRSCSQDQSRHKVSEQASPSMPRVPQDISQVSMGAA